MQELNRLIISCGGTGGHFNPGLSTACAFRDAGGKPLLILGGKHFEEQSKTAEKNGIEYRRVSCAPLAKNPSGALQFFSQQMKGIREAKAIFREFKPDAVLSMGAFPSIPASVAAWRSGIPLFLHDGNARIGKSNRVFSRIATGIALSFPAVNADTLHCSSAVTGLPLRKALLEDVPASKAEAVARINATRGASFSPDRPVVLVFGGSLGAAAINENFTIPIDHPGAKSLQVIHLSGPGKFDAIHDKYSACGVNALTLESASDMQNLYMLRRADPVSVRSRRPSGRQCAPAGADRSRPHRPERRMLPGRLPRHPRRVSGRSRQIPRGGQRRARHGAAAGRGQRHRIHRRIPEKVPFQAITASAVQP